MSLTHTNEDASDWKNNIHQQLIQRNIYQVSNFEKIVHHYNGLLRRSKTQAETNVEYERHLLILKSLNYELVQKEESQIISPDVVKLHDLHEALEKKRK